jgi:hypothetical protein
MKPSLSIPAKSFPYNYYMKTKEKFDAFSSEIQRQALKGTARCEAVNSVVVRCIVSLSEPTYLPDWLHWKVAPLIVVAVNVAL